MHDIADFEVQAFFSCAKFDSKKQD